MTASRHPNSRGSTVSFNSGDFYSKECGPLVIWKLRSRWGSNYDSAQLHIHKRLAQGREKNRQAVCQKEKHTYEIDESEGYGNRAHHGWVAAVHWNRSSSTSAQPKEEERGGANQSFFKTDPFPLFSDQTEFQ